MSRDSKRLAQLMDQVEAQPLENRFLSLVTAPTTRLLVDLSGFSREELARLASVEEEELHLLMMGCLDNETVVRVINKITPYLMPVMMPWIELEMKSEVGKLRNRLRKPSR